MNWHILECQRLFYNTCRCCDGWCWLYVSTQTWPIIFVASPIATEFKMAPLTPHLRLSIKLEIHILTRMLICHSCSFSKWQDETLFATNSLRLRFADPSSSSDLRLSIAMKRLFIIREWLKQDPVIWKLFFSVLNRCLIARIDLSNRRATYFSRFWDDDFENAEVRWRPWVSANQGHLSVKDVAGHFNRSVLNLWQVVCRAGPLGHIRCCRLVAICPGAFLRTYYNQ